MGKQKGCLANSNQSKIAKNNFSKEWKVMHPSGVVENIRSLDEFCRNYNLDGVQMLLTTQNKRFEVNGYRAILAGQEFLHKNDSFLDRDFIESHCLIKSGRLNNYCTKDEQWVQSWIS